MYSLDAITSIKLFLDTPHRLTLWLQVLQDTPPNYDLVYDYIHFFVVALKHGEKDELSDLQNELYSSKIINAAKQFLTSLQVKSESLKKELEEFIQVTEKSLESSSATLHEAEQPLPTPKSVEEPLMTQSSLAKTQVYYNYLASKDLYHLDVDYKYDSENYFQSSGSLSNSQIEEEEEEEEREEKEILGGKYYEEEIYEKRKENSKYLYATQTYTNEEEFKKETQMEIERERNENKAATEPQTIEVDQKLPFLPDSKSGTLFIRSGKLFKTWKQIFLILENQELIVYSDEMKQVKLTQISLKEIISVGMKIFQKKKKKTF